jgi:anti-anti-sigma regulatory factor
MFWFVLEGAGAPLSVVNMKGEMDDQRKRALEEQILAAHAKNMNFLEKGGSR